MAWAKARQSDRLTLSALVTNARARALYERKGFGGEYIRYVLAAVECAPCAFAFRPGIARILAHRWHVGLARRRRSNSTS